MEIQSSSYYPSRYQPNENPSKNKEEVLQEAGKNLSDTKQEVFDPNLIKLKTADAQVRAHEAAHLAAGGGVVTGGANFSYERGSDGRMYAVGGEVPIDAGEAGSPEATIAKARQVVAAAMAPADPSPQDYRVAASALIMEMQARTEMMRETQDKIKANEAYKTDSTDDTKEEPLESEGLTTPL
jgi:hypothetical protein